MAPDQRGEVGDIVGADIHSVRPHLANGFLHVDGVPMHDGIESKTKGAKLLFLSLLERTPDFAAFTVMNAPAEAMAQFSMVELGQNAAAECRVVGSNKTFPKTLLRAVPDAADKAFENLRLSSSARGQATTMVRQENGRFPGDRPNSAAGHPKIARKPVAEIIPNLHHARHLS